MDFIQYCQFKKQDSNWEVGRCDKEWKQLLLKKNKDNSDTLGAEEGFETRLDIVIAEYADAGTRQSEDKARWGHFPIASYSQ
eukprot:9301619-Pyramimonas_sp.AAC.1